MAQLLSPGVYIEEVDASAIVPNVAANIAFLAGNFNRGPQDLPYVVTNKQEYERIFGTPTDQNYNEWFQGYKFFDYANQLVVTRGFNDTPGEITYISPDTPRRELFNYIGEPVPTDTIYETVPVEGGYYGSITPEADYDTSLLVQVYRKEPVDTTLQALDTVFLGTIQAKGQIITDGVFHVDPDNPQTPLNPGDPVAIAAPVGTQSMYIVKLEVDAMAGLTEVNGPLFVVDQVQSSLSIELNIYQNDLKYQLKVNDYFILESSEEVYQVYSMTPFSEIDALGNEVLKIKIVGKHKGPSADLNSIPRVPNGKLYIIAESHQNGGVQAYKKYYDGNIVQTAFPAFNIDAPEGVNGNLINSRRLNYNYELIKNELDFDFQKDQNKFDDFLSGFKLKFFTKTATTDRIEIAIASPEDFESVDTVNHKNYAVAFREQQGTVTKDTLLTALYTYYPVGDQYAVMVKAGDDIETYIVSLDKDALDGNGKSMYIETVINEQSNYVYVINNEGISNSEGIATYLAVDKYGDIPQEADPDKILTGTLVLQGGRNPALDYGALKDAYETVLDKEKYEIDVIIGNEKYPNIAIELADKRKDCIAFIGARFEDTVGKKAIDATNAIVSTILNTNQEEKITRTMFAAYFGNYFRVYDKYNKTYRWINVAGDMAGIRCNVTSNTAPWWVSAGLTRGVIRNINKLSFTPSQEQRDLLYKNGVNPIVAFPGTGNLVWGNKTLHPIASSFDRINVRTLFNTLERSMAKAARSQVFEFNDPYTRNAIQSMFNPYLATIKAGRGITDYLVVCDETNNTPDVIARNELRVDIYIKPNYAAEMILLTFTNVGTRSFADVIGV